MVKLESRLVTKKNKIGILGGSFDPAHKGHLTISKEAIKRFNLREVIWAITKKNPFKKKTHTNLNNRIMKCKKIIGSNKFIRVKFYEDIINSNKTIDLINHISKNKKSKIFFIMGADNLIKFHKWHKWKLISQKCNIMVFDRQGYKTRSLKSITFKQLSRKNLRFIKFKKVNISSSQLRNI